MKLFIGIKIDAKAQKKINSYFNLFYESKVTGNYSKINNLHMTLAFLGETEENKVPLIKLIIKGIKLDINSIKISKLKMLKDILIGEVENNKSIQDIYDSLRKKLIKNNIYFDNHDLYPHVTFIRKVNNCDKFIGKEVDIISNFDHITLFESRRINNDLVYIDLGD